MPTDIRIRLRQAVERGSREHLPIHERKPILTVILVMRRALFWLPSVNRIWPPLEHQEASDIRQRTATLMVTFRSGIANDR